MDDVMMANEIFWANEISSSDRMANQAIKPLKQKVFQFFFQALTEIPGSFG